jgi:L-malate glycosyltransferase
MNIGITCYPTFGGSGIVATEIGLSLARRGHRVHFICSAIPSRLDRFEANVFFHAVEVRGYPLFDHDPYTLALTSKMVEVARFEKLEVLHVHYAIPHATSAYLARQILFDAPPRIVTTLHGTDITLVGNDPSFLPITRFSIAESDAVTAPSEFLRKATAVNFGITDPIEVIPNFVDAQIFHPAEKRDPSLLHRLFDRAPADARVMVHNSNFRPLKRTADAVRVLSEVRHAGVPALLVFVGDGPDRSAAEMLARELGLADCVRFLGNQLNFVPVLQHADVFLLPSELESFGLAALEALSCGVPVVATNQGGVPEVISDGENGLLCAVGDVPAMADAVTRLMRDRDLHDRFARAARATAETRFAREPIIDRYEGVLFKG